EKKTSDGSYEQWLYSLINSIEEQIIQAGKSLKRSTMETFQQDQFIIFHEISQQHLEQNVKQFLDLIEKSFSHISPGLVISWGIGENHAGVKTFNHCFIDP